MGPIIDGMGYTTYFIGTIKLSRKLTVTEQETIRAFYDEESPDGAPDTSCVWTVTEDGDELDTYPEEKMYDWDDWLRYILDEVLEPAGVKANGRTTWQGEDIGDSGVIFVKDNEMRLVGINEMPEPDWDTPEDLEETG
jgi:hypothetical protein